MQGLIPRIRRAHVSDIEAWSIARAILWPQASKEAHMAEILTFLTSDTNACFVAEAGKVLVGFAEVSTRVYANGCSSSPVAFLEGIWVREDYRGKGVAGSLIEQVEAWARTRNLKELASDSEVENESAHRAHEAWGFEEKERVVCFAKRL